jgi:hypothetical protein
LVPARNASTADLKSADAAEVVMSEFIAVEPAKVVQVVGRKVL